MNRFFTKITLFFHYFSLLHRLCQRIEQRPHLWICQYFCQKFRIDFISNSCIIIFLLYMHLWIQILFLIKCFFKKLCIFPSVIIQNMRVHIRNPSKLRSLFISGCKFLTVFSSSNTHSKSLPIYASDGVAPIASIIACVTGIFSNLYAGNSISKRSPFLFTIKAPLSVENTTFRFLHFS